MSEKSSQDKFVSIVKKLTRDIAKHAKEGNEHADKLKLMKAINSAEDRTYRSGLRGEEIDKTFSELRRSAIEAEEIAYRVRTTARNEEIKKLKEKGRLFGYEKEIALSAAMGTSRKRYSSPPEKQDEIITVIEKIVKDIIK